MRASCPQSGRRLRSRRGLVDQGPVFRKLQLQCLVPVQVADSVAFKGTLLSGVPQLRLRGWLHELLVDIDGRFGMRAPATSLGWAGGTGSRPTTAPRRSRCPPATAASTGAPRAGAGALTTPSPWPPQPRSGPAQRRPDLLRPQRCVRLHRKRTTISRPLHMCHTVEFAMRVANLFSFEEPLCLSAAAPGFGQLRRH
jgi:hypothetical protein